MTDDLIWSHDGELYQYDCWQEALDAAYYPEEGMTLYVGRKKPINPARYFGAERIIDNATEAAYDDFGEWFEHFDIHPVHIELLRNFMESWTKTAITDTYYDVVDVKEYTVTAADMLEVFGEDDSPADIF